MSNDDTHGQREYWNQRAAMWERQIDAMERFSAFYGQAAMDRLGVQAGDRVVDIGCGPGATAVELANLVSPGGEVVALDISDEMIEAAKRRSTAAGVANVRFVVSDLAKGALAEDFDAAYSRFGSMFFTDPPAAFANIAGSLRPGGRLSCAVWGPLGENPWLFVPTLAAASILGAELTLPTGDEPGPFSLAEPDRVTDLLNGAGFTDVSIDTLTKPRVVTAAGADAEVRTLLEVGPLGEGYEGADDETRRSAVAAVIDAMEPYRIDDGWSLPSMGHVVGAVRPNG